MKMHSQMHARRTNPRAADIETAQSLKEPESDPITGVLPKTTESVMKSPGPRIRASETRRSFVQVWNELKTLLLREARAAVDAMKLMLKKVTERMNRPKPFP